MMMVFVVVVLAFLVTIAAFEVVPIHARVMVSVWVIILAAVWMASLDTIVRWLFAPLDAVIMVCAEMVNVSVIKASTATPARSKTVNTTAMVTVCAFMESANVMLSTRHPTAHACGRTFALTQPRASIAPRLDVPTTAAATESVSTATASVRARRA